MALWGFMKDGMTRKTMHRAEVGVIRVECIFEVTN